MKRCVYLNVLSACLLGLLSGCETVEIGKEIPADTNVEAATRHVLKVALFPWIPDATEDKFVSLKARLEAEFERQNPGIDLVLRLDKWDDSYYNPAKISGWLASGAYDMVEIDTIILGDLVSAEVIEPWPDIDSSKFYEAAKQGSTTASSNGDLVWWGVPHFMCGFFMISNSDSLNSSDSLPQLLAAVEDTNLPVLGNFKSSWDLPVLYLDALIDNQPSPSSLKDAIAPPLDARAASAIQSLADLCSVDGQNKCLDGTYDEDWDRPINELVQGKAAAFWGYSERLHFTVKELRKAGISVDGLGINTIPLGVEAIPLLFTDAFVRRVGCADDYACSESSLAFVEFINGDWALEEVLLSRDAATAGIDAVPRYLLPAAKSAFDIKAVHADRHFQKLKQFAEIGIGVPSSGEMYERRRLLNWLLMEKLMH